MLAESGAYHYLYEPFNPGAGVGRDVCDVPFTRFFTYIHSGNEAAYLDPIREMVQGQYRWWRAAATARSPRDVGRLWRRHKEFASFRRKGMPPLIKDPIALASAAWMADRFGVDVIVLIRHPAAYVSSMKRMGWGFAPRNWALSQPDLMRDHLEPYRDELERLDADGGDIIDQTALAWKVLNHLVLQYRERYPDWVFVRHEDLSEDPVGGYRRLYQRLGLTFTSEIQATIEGYSGESNPDQAEGSVNTIRLNSRENVRGWRKRLSEDEIARIRARVEPLASQFYSEAEW